MKKKTILLNDKYNNQFDVSKYRTSPYPEGLLPNIPKDLSNKPSLTQEDFVELALGRPLRDVDKAFLKTINQAKLESKDY